MIAAGKASVHALLDYRPRAVEGEKEIMMIKLETVLDRVVVDFRSQAAEMNELLRTRAQWEFFSGGNNLTGCLARCGAFAPGYDQAQIFFEAAQSFFQRAADGGGDAGGVPIETPARSLEIETSRGQRCV
jgi:hypothetical protein